MFQELQSALFIHIDPEPLHKGNPGSARTIRVPHCSKFKIGRQASGGIQVVEEKSCCKFKFHLCTAFGQAVPCALNRYPSFK